MFILFSEISINNYIILYWIYKVVNNIFILILCKCISLIFIFLKKLKLRKPVIKNMIFYEHSFLSYERFLFHLVPIVN